MKRKRRGRRWATAIHDGMNNDDGREWKNLEQRGRSKVEKQDKGRTEEDCVRYCKVESSLRQQVVHHKRNVLSLRLDTASSTRSNRHCIGGKQANQNGSSHEMSAHRSIINQITTNRQETTTDREKEESKG
jgi:hypothetical protein